MLAVRTAIVMLVNGVLFVSRLSTKCLDYICCREAELKVIPVFTTLDDNLQRLVELSMAATVAEQAAWLLTAVRVYYYFQIMSLLIVNEYRA